MNTVLGKVESLLEWIKTRNQNDNIIDLHKTFSAIGIDILPIVIKILELEADFPNSRIKNKDGIKYHELEFFQANISNSNSNNDSNSNSNNNFSKEITNDSLQYVNKQESIFSKLDRTNTILGSTLLKSIILKPYYTYEQIQNIVINRQTAILQIIKLHNSNSYTKTYISNILISLQKIEQELLAMSIEDTPEMEEVYKIIFFEMIPFKYLNYHTLFLKIFYYFMIIFSPLYGLIAPFVCIFIPFLFMKYILKIPIPLNEFLNIIKKMFFGGTGFMTMLDKLFNSQVGAGMQNSLNNGGISIKGVIFWLVRMVISLLNSNLGGYAYVAFIVISYIYGLYNSFQVSITFNKIINMFHSRMNILAKWIRGCMQLYKMQICFDLKELIPILKRIKNLLDDEIIQMLLEHDVFMQEPGLISDKGIIIKCFKLFLDAKKQGRDIIAPFAQYLAYVDVFTALGTWLRENDDRCLAQFILDSKYPIIQGVNLWNLACENPVYNNILLGNYNIINKKINNESKLLDKIIPISKEEHINSKDITDKIDLETKPPEETKEIKEILETKPPEETKEIKEILETKPPEETTKTEETKEIKEIIEKEEITEKEETTKTEETKKIKEILETKLPEETIETEETKKEKLEKNNMANEWFNNIIITGANGAGKSTYIKSITECIILAQTIGLVPAKEFLITPFKHISTYLNIPDCQGKESLFQAEMNRCYQQLETLKAAEEADEFSFNIMDEIFVSTNYQEGMSGAYAVINQLCRFTKCLNIITTHFDKLANLEELKILRKYFDIDILEDGKVSRDYKIKDGVNRKHMALKLLRNRGFSEELVKDAETFYKQNCT